MNPELTKHKNNVLKSVFSNPKLARTFTDALKAPLGSTKRENAKSTLSIIGKLGGANGGQGMGGPMDVSSTPPTGQPDDYSNVMIFPAAPKLKMSNMTPTNTDKNGQGGPLGAIDPFNSNNNFNTKPITGSNWSPTNTNSVGANTLPGTTGGWDSIVNPNKTPITPPTPRNYHPGLLSYANTIGNVLPAVAGIGTMEGLAGGAQWLGQNTAALGERIGSGVVNTLLGSYDPGPNDLKPTPFVSLGDTWGVNKIADMINGVSKPADTWSNLSSNKPVVKSNVTGTSNALGSNNGIVTPENFKPIVPQDATRNNTLTDKNGGNPFTSLAGAVGKTASDVTKGFNLAATNIAGILGKMGYTGVAPDTAYAQIQPVDLAQAIAANEGYFNGTSTVAIQNNNPGNLKFAGQPGATSDAKGFAVFTSPEAGAKALVNDITAKYNSGKYQTINDIMKVYSPDSDNPGYTGGTAGDTTGGKFSTPNADKAISSAQSAVNSNEGAAFYALNQTNAQFGGSLQESINKHSDDLKAQLGLPQLEDALTKLKNEKGNIIPTLQQYMQQQDQYLKTIDQMLANTDESISHIDMSNPTNANLMNNYRAYLVTLQGRQNQRYGNYLNSAISNYNTDVQNAQDHYDNVYKRYTDAMTAYGNISQEVYTNTFQAMSSLYNELKDAPTALINKQILQANLDNANLQLAQNSKIATYGQPTFKSSSEYLPMITDHRVDPTTTKTTDVLKPSSVIDLASLYSQVNQSSLPTSELTAHVTALMREGIQDGNLSTASDYRKAVAKLAQDPTYGPVFASQLAPVVQTATADILTSELTKNADTVKNAVNDLVNTSGGFLGINKSQPGITDEAGWTAKYSGKGLSADVLSALYQAVQAQIKDNPGYKQNPALIFTAPFGDTTKGDISKLTSVDLTKIVTQLVNDNWSASMNPANYYVQTQQ